MVLLAVNENESELVSFSTQRTTMEKRKGSIIYYLNLLFYCLVFDLGVAFLAIYFENFFHVSTCLKRCRKDFSQKHTFTSFHFNSASSFPRFA